MRRRWKLVTLWVWVTTIGCFGATNFDPTGHWDLDLAKTSAARQGDAMRNVSLDFGRDGSFALSEILVKGSWKVVDQKVVVSVSDDQIGLLDHYGIRKLDGKSEIVFVWSSAEDRLLWKFYNSKAKVEREYWFKKGS